MLFDSGVGGLTILRELRQLVPKVPIIYAADLMGLPYGEKSEAQIAARVASLLGRLNERYTPCLACIACNTASTIALEAVREVLEIPIVGTVPAIKPASSITKTGKIGLLGTRATIRQAYVDNLEKQFAQQKKLIRYAAPELVEAAENKVRGLANNRLVFANALAGLFEQSGGEDIDTIVLACTHFPLLERELRQETDREMTFVHGGAGIARRIVQLLDPKLLEKTGSDTLVVTGERQGSFEKVFRSYGFTEFHSL